MGILDSLESGLKSVLPYALPAALGAGLGGPLGGLAGVAAAQPDPDEQLKRQKEALDIEAEQAGLQQATQQRAGEQQFLKDPGFLQYAGQALGIDPSHLSSFQNLPLDEVSKLIENAQKARMAGNKLSNLHQLPNGTWAGTNEFGQERPLGGTPASVIAERERGLAESGRTDKTIAAAGKRTETTQAGANKRAADARAAAQAAKQETDIQNTLKSAATQYKALNPLGSLLGPKAEDYAKYLTKQLEGIPGITHEEAIQRGYAAAGLNPPKSSDVPAGWVNTGRFTKDGHKPVYLDPKTGKKYIL